MNPFALIPARWWINLGAAAIIGLALWNWGHHRYKQGVNDTTATYERAAAQQREINAKASFRAAERVTDAQKAFVETETVIEVRYVKDQAALADVWRYADRLRDELARRGAAPVEATSACATQDRRLRSGESLVGEYVEALAACAGTAVEGRHLAEKLNNKVQLWRDYVDALP